MGIVINIREARQARRRRRQSELNARCRELIEEGITAWRSRAARADSEERAVCQQRVRSLTELLAYASTLGPDA